MEKKKEMDFLLEPPSRRNMAFQHLDFNPGRLIWDFRPPELEANKLVLFSATDEW